MKTLELLSSKLESVPLATSWYLSDLGEARGKQELFTKQSPQKLKVLREHALIESALSSNRIEGITIDRSRVKAVVLGKSALRDRDEQEVRGYREALQLIHEQRKKLRISEPTILHLHVVSRANIGDAGRYKDKDGDIIEKYPDGRVRVRFKTVLADKTAESMQEMIGLWDATLRDRRVHPVIAMAAMNLDFLCIHPFRDGNGRVSRLLLLLQCYQFGYEVGRYISLERIIESSKDRYYETLEQSSGGWHGGKHDPWPYINYILYTLKTAYREFETRVGQIKSPRGSKTELVQGAIGRTTQPFTVAEIQYECPGASVDLIRRVLRDLLADGLVQCLGRGQNAKWQKTGQW